MTAVDLEALGKMLVEAGGTTEVIAQVAEQSHGLGLFIRSLVGLDRETATQAFSQFVVMDAARLYESPFTDISQQGPEALFLSDRVTEKVRVLEEIRKRAVG